MAARSPRVWGVCAEGGLAADHSVRGAGGIKGGGNTQTPLAAESWAGACGVCCQTQSWWQRRTKHENEG